MNLVILDNNPEQAAKSICDQHIHNMILESVKLLSSAHYYLDSNLGSNIYRLLDREHPFVIWTYTRYQNYQWLFIFYCSLLNAYIDRYGKIHKCTRSVIALANNPAGIMNKQITQFPKYVPKKYKVTYTIEAYRNYYYDKHKNFAAWNKLDNKPEWFKWREFEKQSGLEEMKK